MWRAAGIVAMVALSACSSLLVDAPRKLYRLTTAVSFSNPLPHRSTLIEIDPPSAPNAFDTARIALSRSQVSLDYFADAEWTDRAPRLLQTALLDAFNDSKAMMAIDQDSAGLRGDFALTSELRHFEAKYEPISAKEKERAPQVWVALNMRLVKLSDHSIVAQRLFEQRVGSGAPDIPSIVLAFDAAVSGVAREAVVWVVTNPALSPKR